MKYLAMTLSIFTLAAASQSFASEPTPSKVSGEIQNAFCGNVYDLSSVKGNLATCILWVKTGTGQKIAAFTSHNGTLPFLGYGVDGKILVGQKVNMQSCDPLTDSHFTKKYTDAMKVLNVDKSYNYISCYPDWTKLEAPTGKNELNISKLAGLYVGKSKVTSKLVKAKVVVTQVKESEQGDMFAKPKYDIEIIYFGDQKVDEYGLASLSTGSTDLKPVFSTKGISYVESITQDCDDPDCYNTNGEVKFIQNKNGNYTLGLEIYHYNAAPSEMGDESDFEESVFMKKIEE